MLLRMVLHLDFPVVELGKRLEAIQCSFNRICNGKLDGYLGLPCWGMALMKSAVYDSSG